MERRSDYNNLPFDLPKALPTADMVSLDHLSIEVSSDTSSQLIGSNGQLCLLVVAV